MLIKIVAAVLLAAVVLYMTGVFAGRVKPEEARRLVGEGAILLDVRTGEEFGAGHLDGAINISVASLSNRLAELPDKSRPIVVYCRSGQRSGRAKRLLASAGYTQVHDLGPMSAWR